MRIAIDPSYPNITGEAHFPARHRSAGKPCPRRLSTNIINKFLKFYSLIFDTDTGIMKSRMRICKTRNRRNADLYS